MSEIRVSAVIPTLNEEETIGGVIAGIVPYCDEILVVDSRSDDRTAEIARSAGARTIPDGRRGKGAAIRLGVSEARGETVVLMDGDGSHDGNDIPKMVAPIQMGEADLVIGSRFLGGSDELHGTWDNLMRSTGSCLAAVLINTRWKTQLTDVENGFKAIRRDLFGRLNLKRRDFVIEQEMVIQALRLGLRVREIPSHEYARRGGTSKLATSQGWKFLWHLFRELCR
jgi:glycosyltransferase involved in cell wall biosynthesis